MGRRKVTINKNPLEAQTVGKYKAHNFGFIVVFFVIILFGAVIYFLPNLFAIYDNYTRTGQLDWGFLNFTNTNNGTSTNTNTNTTDTIPIPEPEPEPEPGVENYLVLNTDTSVTVEGINFNNISYQNKQISLTISTNKDSIVRLYNQSYFLKVYNENKELIKNHFFSNNVIGSLNVTIDNIADAYYYEIKYMKDTDYPYFTLPVDADEKSYLTCSKDNNKIKYTFVDEVYDLVEDTTTDSLTDSVLNEFDQFKTKYEGYNGVTINILSGNTYQLVVKVDMKKYNGYIKPYYFNKDAYPREIRYKIETMGYTCG